MMWDIQDFVFLALLLLLIVILYNRNKQARKDDEESKKLLSFLSSNRFKVKCKASNSAPLLPARLSSQHTRLLE